MIDRGGKLLTAEWTRSAIERVVPLRRPTRPPNPSAAVRVYRRHCYEFNNEIYVKWPTVLLKNRAPNDNAYFFERGTHDSVYMCGWMICMRVCTSKTFIIDYPVIQRQCDFMILKHRGLPCHFRYIFFSYWLMQTSNKMYKSSHILMKAGGGESFFKIKVYNFFFFFFYRHESLRIKYIYVNYPTLSSIITGRTRLVENLQWPPLHLKHFYDWKHIPRIRAQMTTLQQ